MYNYCITSFKSLESSNFSKILKMHPNQSIFNVRLYSVRWNNLSCTVDGNQRRGRLLAKSMWQEIKFKVKGAAI
jgi:hypothetical protein